MLFDTSSHVGRDRLADLGLDVPTIHNVLAVGAAEQATYTSFDAPGASEMARWSRHIRRLSELLVPQGWARRDPLNQPTLVHPAARHCLLVTSGSVWTGTDLGVPATKNPKGRSIREAVEKNSELALLSVGELDPVLEGLRDLGTAHSCRC